MTETACSPFRNSQFPDLFPFSTVVPGNDHLRDPLPVSYYKILCRKVDKNHLDLSPVIGIDGSRRVE